MTTYNFTERLRGVLNLARYEAFVLGHGSVGTEHLLLGLLSADGVASAVFDTLGVSVPALATRVHEVVTSRGPPPGPPPGDLPYTERTKVVLGLSMAESRAMDHSYVGTEHLLLGLLAEGEGRAAELLIEAGLTLDGCRRTVASILDTPLAP